MCGIAGYFGTERLDETRIERCLRMMGRRGPDFTSCKSFTNEAGRNTYLLHSRLSIIDLDERANQPFEVDGQWLAFNGELYNYVELRNRIPGYNFRTQSDTEVFGAAIRRYGWSILDRCEGMWALAVYDSRRGELTLSRDRFGEKPLYVYKGAEGIYFGSEPKFVFALLGRSLPVNRSQISRFLVNGYKSIYKGRDTFFEGLEEVPPGTNLTIDAMGRVATCRYWRPAFEPSSDMSYRDAVDGFRQRLIEAVRLRLRSDVPMAFMMSGGVDSSAIISIAKRTFGYDVHGFTVMNEDERYDEKPMVEASVAELGIKHTTLTIRQENFLSRLRELVRQHDAPVYTISAYIQWLLIERIADAGYRVVFSGAGADELVSGYYDHHLMYLSEIRGAPGYEEALAAWSRYVKPIVRNPFLSNPHLFDESWHFREHIYLNNDVWAEYLTKPFIEGFEETAFTQSLLRNRMMNEMFHEGVRVILHEDDLNAMYYSIENRSPFLDRELFEFAYRIPNEFLIRDGFNKVVLRDAVRGVAPDCVVNERRKVGFNAPVLSFLDTANPTVVAELMQDSPVFDVIEPDKLAGLLEKRELANSASKFLFNFVSVKMFLEEFAGGAAQ